MRRALTYLLVLSMCVLFWGGQVARPAERASTGDIATNGYQDTDDRATQFESFDGGAQKFKRISCSRPLLKAVTQRQGPATSKQWS